VITETGLGSPEVEGSTPQKVRRRPFSASPPTHPEKGQPQTGSSTDPGNPKPYGWPSRHPYAFPPTISLPDPPKEPPDPSRSAALDDAIDGLRSPSLDRRLGAWKLGWAMHFGSHAQGLKL
jgi:hypothetical protein